MEQKIKALSKENLQDIILNMMGLLSKEQCEKLEVMIEACTTGKDKIPLTERMSQEFVDEKMELLREWMNQIDEGELYLDVDEYEDYSDSYWDRDWITDYYDNQGIGDKVEFIIRFAQDCVDDRKYQEANDIYEWLWEMSVSTDFESEIVEESRKLKISTFWNYFQRWKKYFRMPQREKNIYFDWAEKIVYGRADAIVSGQYRRHYGEVAELLALVAEIKECRGEARAKQMIFQEYKKKFPRHSSFQAEMRSCFKCELSE